MSGWARPRVSHLALVVWPPSHRPGGVERWTDHLAREVSAKKPPQKSIAALNALIASRRLSDRHVAARVLAKVTSLPESTQRKLGEILDCNDALRVLNGIDILERSADLVSEGLLERAIASASERAEQNRALGLPDADLNWTIRSLANELGRRRGDAGGVE